MNAAAQTVKATIRTYRHGLGDCHLVTLFGKDSATYRILIDCGVILGTADATRKMTDVMVNVLDESKEKVDLLVATHEHWDHVSGFLQAKDSFAKLKIDEVWMGWTEDPNDADGKSLGETRGKALAMLQGAAMRMQLDGSSNGSLVTSMLEFFGAAGSGLTTKDALEAVRNKEARKLRYCDPKDPPTDLAAFGAKIYVLGPPRDIRLLKKILPTNASTQSETYRMAELAFETTVAPTLGDLSADQNQPFASSRRIPLSIAKTTTFFQEHYWESEPWRRIDTSWMADAEQFALALDSLTNNTSLVLAIDITGVGVLLFAADAQVGNWLSWGDCKWTVDGNEVTGPDLLKRTIFYKVGHHGSYNATLRDQGLSLMEALRYAVIPVDHAMAIQKRWGNIPLGTLQAALEDATKDSGFVLRTDEEPSAVASLRGAVSAPLYFDVNISG